MARTEADEIAHQLRILGLKRTAARHTVRETTEKIAALVKDAHAAGISKTNIADMANISRPTLDEMLK